MTCERVSELRDPAIADRTLRERAAWVRAWRENAAMEQAPPAAARISDFAGWDVLFAFRPAAASPAYVVVETMSVVRPWGGAALRPS